MVAAAGGGRGVPVADRDVVARGDLASVVDERDEAVGDVGLREGGGRRARELKLAVRHVRDREDEARVEVVVVRRAEVPGGQDDRLALVDREAVAAEDRACRPRWR